MVRDRHRDRKRRSSRPSRSKRPARDYADEFDDHDDHDDDDEDDDIGDYDEAPARTGPPRRKAPARGPRGRERGRSSKRGRIDFAALESGEYYPDKDELPKLGSSKRGRREPERGRRRRGRNTRSTLDGLCTPVFGYAIMLPREEGGAQPEYLNFRQGVVSALQQIESSAADNGIDPQDAREAVYALAAFMDEQVNLSTWDSREQWSGEPLNIVMSQDPEAGVNFFRRLEGLRGDQLEVKKVYLYCLSLGFKGKYALEDARVQTEKIGALKAGLLEDLGIHGLDDSEFLFPAAYEPSDPLEDEVELVPSWWKWASLGIVAAVVLIYIGLLFLAGALPDDAVRSLQSVLTGGS